MQEIDDDEWFCSLPPERKSQIRGWLDKPAPSPASLADADPLQTRIELAYG